MRLQIHFSTEGGQLLPFNYQYPLSSWIYHTLSQGNTAYANFLHQQGYSNGHKQFKLFTFSKFRLPKFKPLGDRMKLDKGQLSLIISLKVEEAAQNLVLGMFKQQQIRIGDEISQVDLKIESLELLQQPAIQNQVKLRTLSPIIIGRREEGKRYAQYISPDHPRYANLFAQNLIHKYHAWEKTVSPISSDNFQPEQIQFRFINFHRKASQLVQLKSFTKEETKVKGYQYDFELSAPKALIEFGLEAGFGEKNAMGFGCCRVV